MHLSLGLLAGQSGFQIAKQVLLGRGLSKALDILGHRKLQRLIGCDDVNHFSRSIVLNRLLLNCNGLILIFILDLDCLSCLLLDRIQDVSALLFEDFHFHLSEIFIEDLWLCLFLDVFILFLVLLLLLLTRLSNKEPIIFTLVNALKHFLLRLLLLQHERNLFLIEISWLVKSFVYKLASFLEQEALKNRVVVDITCDAEWISCDD